MSIHERYDLLILGSGSTAFAAAIHAQELGKTAVRHLCQPGLPALQEPDRGGPPRLRCRPSPLPRAHAWASRCGFPVAHRPKG